MALVKTCKPDPMAGTSEELVWLEHLKGMVGDESSHINKARSEGCCMQHQRN